MILPRGTSQDDALRDKLVRFDRIGDSRGSPPATSSTDHWPISGVYAQILPLEDSQYRYFWNGGGELGLQVTSSA